MTLVKVSELRVMACTYVTEAGDCELNAHLRSCLKGRIKDRKKMKNLVCTGGLVSRIRSLRPDSARFEK